MTDSIHKQHVRAFDTHGRLHTESRLNIPMHYITRTYARGVLHDTRGVLEQRADVSGANVHSIALSNYLI